MSPLRRKKTKIGKLLLLTGMITSDQLEQALSLQLTQSKDVPLGQILLKLGYINEEMLGTVLSLQSGYPYIQIKYCKIEPSLLSLIPEAMARKYQVLPIDKIQDFLTIAMVNPLDKIVVDQIKKITKSNVTIFLTTPSELNEMFSMCYGKK